MISSPISTELCSGRNSQSRSGDVVASKRTVMSGSAAPGVTPDRTRGFEAGPTEEDAAAEGSTGGDPPPLGHLRSVVGLVWRSVVLWMLLVALLTLANLVG